MILCERTSCGTDSIRLVLSLITLLLLLLLTMGKKPSSWCMPRPCELALLLLYVALEHRLPVHLLNMASECVGLKLNMHVPLPCRHPLPSPNRYGPRVWNVVRMHNVGSPTPDSTSMLAYLGIAMFAASRLIDRATAPAPMFLLFPLVPVTVPWIPLNDPLPLLLLLTPLLLVVRTTLQLPNILRR